MKKIFALLLAVACFLAMGGCMGTSNATKTATATDPSDAASVSYKDYSNTLEGLCQYLNDLGYMVFDYDASKDEAGTATIKMQADMIGAEKGYKSTYTYNKETWTVEAYYYSDTASDMYKEALSGEFTISENIDGGTFEITVNGNYAIVVSAPKDGDERKADILEAFNAFYA